MGMKNGSKKSTESGKFKKRPNQKDWEKVLKEVANKMQSNKEKEYKVKTKLSAHDIWGCLS